MQHDSMYHVLDRFLAIPLMIMEVWKISCLWKYAAPRQTAVIATVLNVVAVYCFLQSQHAQSKFDVEEFILWHNRWHM